MEAGGEGEVWVASRVEIVGVLPCDGGAETVPVTVIH